ncbi:PA2778 family cysteine peptidase [Vreelandella arcis]|uniref:Peptidase_C39 like family protein n=1 Tax=Vreelandella arcis TaxID=416873 RepID=A0A1H0F0G9_9GAMM|nr:PA2778 family cysteine peptidase [Halomonas arcis]SDN88073.1 Peptidase_C39 like family protein [Halomonas arcis]
MATIYRFQNARLAGVLLLLCLLSACASTPSLRDTTEQQLPRQSELADVPFYAQTEYQCGPAALAMVLTHQGVDTDVETLIPQVFIPGREGSVQPEMLATVRRHERLALPIRGTFDDLLKHLAAGDPVVVMQNLSLPAFPMWHYAVAIGYNLDDDSITLRSGEIERHTIAFSRFDATWARTDRWGFVVAKPGTLPEGITAHNALTGISAYEELHGPKATLSSWQAMVERYPGHALAQFALGNAYYADEQPDKALSAFQSATRNDPEMGAAWLNIGLLQLQQNQPDAARQALTQAASIEGSWQARAQELLGQR